MADNLAQVCMFCGFTKQQHMIANYSDGNQIARALFICPSSIFAPVEATKESERRDGC